MIDCNMYGQGRCWQSKLRTLQGCALLVAGLLGGCQPTKSPVGPSSENSSQASQTYTTAASEQVSTRGASVTDPTTAVSAPTKRSVTLLIAASTNLNSALPVMVEDFNRLHPDIALKVTYDTSDKLAARIRQHNNFDIFLTASQVYTQDLYAASQQHSGLRYGQPFIYARGQLVLYSTKYALTDTPTQLLDDLLIQHAPLQMALSDPERSPYGSAAQAWLVNQNFASSTQIQLQPYANLIQTFAATDQGLADFGFVSLAQVLSKARDNTVREATKTRSYAPLSKADYPTILHEGMVLKPSTASQQFVSYLLSSKGQLLLTEAGYLPVCGDNSLKLPACS